jgi:multiple sugar transport system permease protein
MWIIERDVNTRALSPDGTPTAGSLRGQQAGSLRAARIVGTVVAHAVAVALAVIFIFPLLWMLSSSVKPKTELFIFPPQLIPSTWHFENYARAWEAARFSIYFTNSVVVAVGGTLFTLGVCAMAAYAFSKLHFKGRDTLFWAVLMSQMIPGVVTLIPVFLVVKSIPLAGGNNLLGQGGHGWLNSYAGLIVPGMGGAFGVFLLRQFFQSVPDDLLDAARVDGSSEFGIFYKVVLPLAKPALVTLAIFTFQAYWNDFLWPLVITTDDRYRTIQLGLTVFRQRFTTDWGPLMAGVAIATLPMILVFISAQRYFVSGIAMTGLKG